jgi:hypothetical protein
MQNKNRSKANKPNRAKPKGFAGALRDLQLASFTYAGTIRPGKQSPQKTVGNDIPKPDYSQDGMVRRHTCLLLLLLLLLLCVNMG